MDDTRDDQDDKAPDAQGSDDQALDGQASDEKPSDDHLPPDGDAGDERLDELGDRIQSVRSEAEDVVEGVADPDEEKFADSGDDKATDEDDQTIAPPG